MYVRPRAHESAQGACSPPTASIAAFSLSIIDSARIVFVLHLSGSAPFPRARALHPGRRTRVRCCATVGGRADARAGSSATAACNRYNNDDLQPLKQ
jgi:hypothetical protein